MLNKKWLIIPIAILFAGFISSCSYVKVNEDRDNAQVVAEINGTPILKGQYKETAQTILGNYQMTLEDVDESSDPNMYKEYILEQLINDELLYQQAVKEGRVDMSDEHISELVQQQSDQADSFYQIFLTQAQNEGAADPEAAALSNWNDYLRQNGFDDLEGMAEKQIRNTAVNDIYQEVTANVAATEQDAKEYYDMQVSAQQSLVESDPQNYLIYKKANQAFVNPAGSRYVKNLLIQIPYEVQSEISSLRAAGDDAAADALRDNALKEIEQASQNALERVKNGEDFDAVMEEVGEDPGMQNEPGKTYGYLVIDGGQDYVQEFQDAAMSLSKAGEITDLVPTDYGYHIIEYLKDGEGPVDFEMVKDSIISTRTSSKQTDALTEYIEGLRNEAQITKYLDRV